MEGNGGSRPEVPAARPKLAISAAVIVFIPTVLFGLIEAGVSLALALPASVLAAAVAIGWVALKTWRSRRLAAETIRVAREAIRATTTAPAERITWGEPSPFGGLDLAGCRCLFTSALRGPLAQEYARNHLGTTRSGLVASELQCPAPMDLGFGLSP